MDKTTVVMNLKVLYEVTDGELKHATIVKTEDKEADFTFYEILNNGNTVCYNDESCDILKYENDVYEIRYSDNRLSFLLIKEEFNLMLNEQETVYSTLVRNLKTGATQLYDWEYIEEEAEKHIKDMWKHIKDIGKLDEIEVVKAIGVRNKQTGTISI